MATIQAAQNYKQINPGGLGKLLKLKICPKFMLRVNLDIHDCLITSQAGNFVQGRFRKAYVKTSDEQAGLTAMISSYLGRQSSWIPI